VKTTSTEDIPPPTLGEQKKAIRKVRANQSSLSQLTGRERVTILAEGLLRSGIVSLESLTRKNKGDR
jgi:hypothetical protein